jgi:hypothetical protein
VNQTLLQSEPEMKADTQFFNLTFETIGTAEVNIPETLTPEKQYPHTPNLTLALAPELRRPELTLAVSLKRYIDFAIGTDKETNKCRRKAMKSSPSAHQSAMVLRYLFW